MRLGIRGVKVGHANRCTVVLLPAGTVASGEVRGGAPATREFALLAPEAAMERVDAVVMTGGSAFGLAAADGVMRFLEERSLGYETESGHVVPIVPAMSIFDLDELRDEDRPGPADGHAAALAATEGELALGRVGAGTGATIGLPRRPAGMGAAVVARGRVKVAALVVVNAAGDVAPAGYENTTIGVVVTNAKLSKLECYLVARSGHDGLARALFPAHTRGDGDALVAAAAGRAVANVDVVRMLATQAVEQAILAGARNPG